jgi:hypothetical protein
MTGFFVELGLEHPFLPEILRTLGARAGAVSSNRRLTFGSAARPFSPRM